RTSAAPPPSRRTPSARARTATSAPRVPRRGGQRALLLSRRELSAVPDLAGPRPRCGLGPARALDRGGRPRDLPCPDHVRSPEGPPSIPLGSSRPDRGPLVPSRSAAVSGDSRGVYRTRARGDGDLRPRSPAPGRPLLLGRGGPRFR